MVIRNILRGQFYVNPQAQACHNIKIADQIGNDQTFVPGSVVITPVH